MKFLWIGLIISCSAVAQLDNQFISYSEASKMWNMEPFDSATFKTLRQEDRAGMALDIMNRGIFNNKKLVEVKKALGPPDGHYEIHYALAYLLGSDDKNNYQLIFLPDFAGKTVENIKIYHEPLDSHPEPVPSHPERSEGSPSIISTKSKRLPIDIDGAVAKSLYEHLKRVPELKGTKTGKNISCTRDTKRIYRCNLQIDEEGSAFSK